MNNLVLGGPLDGKTIEHGNEGEDRHRTYIPVPISDSISSSSMTDVISEQQAGIFRYKRERFVLHTMKDDHEWFFWIPVGESREFVWERLMAGYIPVRETVTHKKRGSQYAVLGDGRLQTSVWGIAGDPSCDTVDMEPVTIYKSLADGELWVRPKDEFEDGGFVR